MNIRKSTLFIVSFSILKVISASNSGSNLCADGTYLIKGSVGGCLPCQCDQIGSLSNSCDKNDGSCFCRPGYGGRNCSQCPEFFYGKPMSVQQHPLAMDDLRCCRKVDGCTWCQCNPAGSKKLSCDGNGLCSCKRNVVGPKCDRCHPSIQNALFPECLPRKIEELCPALCVGHWNKTILNAKKRFQSGK